jgi:hypothetical protein
MNVTLYNWTKINLYIFLISVFFLGCTNPKYFKIDR